MKKPRYSSERYYDYDTDDTGIDVSRHQSGHSSMDQPTIWSHYIQRGEHYDKELVEDSNNTVEVLLIFAGLFSAVVTGFISQTYPMLQPDPKDILTSIYQELRNPGVNTTMDTPFVAPSYAIRVNCFLFAGLFTSMLVALLGTLVKQWTSSYQRELAVISSHHLRARTRHFRFNGTKRWHLAGIVGLLSIFMHVALFISAIGIIDLLLSTVPTVGYVALSVFLVGVIFFLVTTILPLFVPDAPFRSPLSNILSRIRRSVKTINVPTYFHHLRSRVAASDQGIAKEEEGLEDPIEQSQGEDLKENNIVRHSIRLDIDIICHLLSTADRVTEQWLLDMCFEKLPSLALLEQHDPHVFYSHGIIMEVYNFLAGRCIMTNRQGDKEVNSDRLPRARQLCKFLAWYLSLSKTPKERENLQITLDKNRSATTLATLLADDDHIPSIIAATTALGHLQHIREPRSSEVCPTCQKWSSEVKSWADGEPLESRDEVKVKQVTSLLVKRTDCMILWDKHKTEPTEKTAAECQASLNILQQAIRKCIPPEKDKRLWIQVLSEKEKMASASLKELWFTPLRTTLDGLPTRRRISPFNPPVNSSTGSDTTILSPPNSPPFLPPPTSISPSFTSQ